MRPILLASLLTLSALVACGGDGDHAHDHDDQSHRHEPLYGGTLVELGDHVAHVELVLEAETGRLSLHSLGAHAEEPVRLADETLEVVVELDGGELTLTLEAVESALSGETVGDTSEFAVVDERLVGLDELAGRIPAIETRGERFEDVVFPQ